MDQRRAGLDSVALVLVVGCCFLWGLNQVAVKLAMAEVPVLWQAAIRLVGGALLVGAWSRLRGVPLFHADATLPGGLLAGALFGAEFLCIFIGLQYTSASRMAVFLYLSPFVVACGMPFLSRAERLSTRQVGGLLLALAGVAWAFAEGFTRPGAGEHQLLGDALGVTAGMLWGGTTLTIRATRLASAPAEKTLLYQLAVSGVLLTACALISRSPWPSALSPLAAASLLFQTVIVTALSYVVWFWLIRTYPATLLASFTLLTPVFGLLMGVWLLREPVTARLLTALAGVSAGILLVNLPPKSSD